MGLGYLGSSSSSSSSNLSPLALPFTVDRSNHNKPTLNSNPVSHFSDSSYGVPFSSSWPYSHPSTAGQEFLADSLRTATVPSNDYRYTIPEPINPSSTRNWSGLNSNGKHGLESINPARGHWSAVAPTPKPVADSFSYNLNEAKPFYPPYVSSVNNDDIPLVTLSEPSYNLLSTSGLVHADESSQVDYTRSLSGLEYNSQREGLWSGLPEGKQGEKMESDDSFFSEEANIAASLVYNDSLNQGAYGAETLGKGKDDPSMFYYADIIRRENNIGPPISGNTDCTSFSANNPRLDPNEFSKGGSTFRAFPMFSESHPLIQSSEPSEEPWNSQKSYTLYEKRFHMFDCSDDRMSTSITKSSPLLIKPQAAVSTFSAQGTASSKSSEIGNIATLNISDVVGGHKPMKEKELHLPQGLESKGSFLTPNQLSFQIGRTDEHTFVAPSSTKEDVSSKLSANDRLNFEFKARPSFQVPDISIPNGNIAENVKSAANSFERFDHHNPAEDSPCWKGVPSSHFLPFGSPEAESPPHPTKKLQTGNGGDLQGSQTDHFFNNSSKVHETRESNEKTSGSLPVQKEQTGEVVDVGFNSAKASSGGGAQSVHDTIKPKKGHGLSNESTSDANSQSSKLKLPNSKEDIISPEMKIQLLYGDVDHTIRAVEHVLVSSIEDAANLATAKKVNAHILVKALHNLSDLLLLHCSNDEYALKEQDHEALDHVIGNLDVCMSRKIQVASTPKLMLPQQNTSNISQEDAYVGKSQGTNETSGIFHDDQVGQRGPHDRKRNSDIIGENVGKLLECVSLRDEADPPKDHNMVQAITKVLDENLECKDELPSETLLYKNLWLEAEAELCSLNYRARFERMKRETEKGKSDKSTVSDASASRAVIKEISSCNGSPDLKIPPKLMPQVDGSKVSNTNVQNRHLSGADSHIDDVEASVMARFNVLKRRGELNPVNFVEEEAAGVKDSGKGSQRSGATVQHRLCKDDAVVVGLASDDVEPWLMSRLNILKRRGESNAIDVEEKECADGEVYGEESGSSKGPHFQDEANKEEAVGMESGWYTGSGSDWEHILKDEFGWQSDGRLS